MKDQRKTEIKVGITVTVGILALIWILSWAKNFSFATADKIVKVQFDNVSGLEIGDYVTVNGVRKGFVEDFNIDGERVIVQLSISSDVDLREDAKFLVTMLDLMGGKKVSIKPGVSSNPIEYNKIQNGTFASDVPEVMSLLGNVQDDLVTVISDVKITLSSINSYLSDNEFNSNVRLTLSNLTKVTEKLNLMIDENRNSIKKLTSNSVELTEEAKQFIKDNKSDIKSSLSELQSILVKTDTLLTHVNKFADETTTGNNNLGKFLYNEEIYNNLQQSLKQLNELTKLLNDQLKNEGLKVDADINLF